MQLYVVNEQTSALVTCDIDGDVGIYTYTERSDGMLAFDHSVLESDFSSMGGWIYPDSEEDFHELLDSATCRSHAEWRQIEFFYAGDTWTPEEIELLHDLSDVLHGRERAACPKYDSFVHHCS